MQIPPLDHLSEEGRTMEGLGPTSEDDQGQILQQERDPDRSDQGGDAGGLADRKIGPAIDGDSQQCRHENGGREGDPPGKRKDQIGVESEIAAHHQDIAVGEIDQPQNSIDHGVSDGDQSVETSQGDSIDELLEKHGSRHCRIFPHKAESN